MNAGSDRFSVVLFFFFTEQNLRELELCCQYPSFRSCLINNLEKTCFLVINFFIIFQRNSFVDLIQQSAIKFIVLLYEQLSFLRRFATEIPFYNFKLLKKIKITTSYYITLLLNFSTGLLNSTELFLIQISISTQLLGQKAFKSII